jgi:acyl-CoA synthetase (NDP forming)
MTSHRRAERAAEMTVSGRRPVLLDARSVAVIGASPDDAKIGGKPMRFFREFGFRGDVYPVNPKYGEIAGYRCYPDLTSISGEIDLAVITVPHKDALAVVEQCARKGVAQIVMFSSGYAETGPEGEERQRSLLRAIEGTSVRLLGPNSLGFANLATGLIANFGQGFELPRDSLKSGSVGFVSQSGAFGTFIFTLTAEQGVGFKYFAVTGNEADITFSELMAAMIDDPDINLIAGYIEGIRDGRRFLEVCEAARAAGKPIVVIKTGRTPGGSAAALSHTAAIAGADEVYQAVFRQTGVLRVADEEEMLDVLTLMRSHKRMHGRRVGVLTMSGGAGVMLADAIDSSGLELAQLTSRTEVNLAKIIPAFGSTRNPVDLTGQFLTDPGMLHDALDCLMADPNVDGGVFFMGLGRRYGERIADTLRQVVSATDKPILVAWTAGPASIIAQLRNERISVLPSPTRAVRALSSLWRFSQAHARQARTFAVQATSAARIIASGKTCRCSEMQTKALLCKYQVTLLPERLANSEDEAVACADALGYPVALKVCAADLIHKTEAGAVALKIKCEQTLRAAYRDILSNAHAYAPDLAVDGVLVAPMAEDGVEVIIGARRDPVFGPIIVVGSGGIYAEVLHDAAIGVLPLIPGEAHDLIRSLRIHPLLNGARGKPKADVNALIHCIEATSRLLLEHPEVAEIEINPLRVLTEGRGAFPLDALMILEGPQ